MGILYFLIIASAYVIVIFLYTRIIRLLKKKSHHYIIPPKPEEDKNWKPINFQEYECFIYLQKSSNSFVLSKLDSIFYDDNTGFKPENIKIAEKDNSFLLKLINLQFVDYMSFMPWLDENSRKKYNSQGEVTGFCRHCNNNQVDFIVKKDDELDDHLIGSFRNGKNFGVYLPFSELEEGGNISLTINNEIDFDTEISKFSSQLMHKELISYAKLKDIPDNLP